MLLKWIMAVALAAPVETWNFSENYRPATLRDCPPQTKIVVNMSSSIYGPWQTICYWGKHERK